MFNIGNFDKKNWNTLVVTDISKKNLFFCYIFIKRHLNNVKCGVPL